MRIFSDHFDIRKIAESGQCFRWKKITEQAYEIPLGSKRLSLRQVSTDALEAACEPEEWESLWSNYFDMQTDYAAIDAAIDPGDTYLQEAAEAARGIRILRQPVWEMIVSFLISQNNNIPRITRTIERLCERHGGFPTREDILRRETLQTLRECGLGYRASYLLCAASLFTPEEEALLQTLPYSEAQARLMRCTGIGPKVADCICLYGLGLADAFPVDTWMRRALQAHYPEGFPFQKYPKAAGVYQQYIFFYERELAGATHPQ